MIGQPNLNLTVDREQAARYQINVADVQDAIQTAVGGNAVSQVLQGEQRYDLVVRYLPPLSRHQGRRSKTSACCRLPASASRWRSFRRIQMQDGASEIYREENSRYVAIKYSVRGRDLGSTVEEAMRKVNEQVKLPPGYRIDWAGEYESQKRSARRLLMVLPITIFVIFMILYSMFRSAKWACSSWQSWPWRRSAVCWRFYHRYALQRVVRRWFSGAVRRVGANRRDHAGIHQSASRPRAMRSSRPPSRERCCGCARS